VNNHGKTTIKRLLGAISGSVILGLLQKFNGRFFVRSNTFSSSACAHAVGEHRILQ